MLARNRFEAHLAFFVPCVGANHFAQFFLLWAFDPSSGSASYNAAAHVAMKVAVEIADVVGVAVVVALVAAADASSTCRFLLTSDI